MKAIEVTNLTKNYGKITAVNDVSFSVEKGAICGILGPNGSGKTTTIKSICNLIIPDKGEIKLFNKENRKSIEHISALFEGTRNLYWRLTPRENLRYFAGIRGMGGKKIESRIDELLDRFNLSEKRDITVNTLSRGMQQKIAIAMTLVCDTEIVLLDEPTLGLDVQSYIDIKNILRNIASDMDKTILLSTHHMDLVQELCNQVVILNKGKLVAKDSVENLLNMFKSMTYEIILLEKVNKEIKNHLMSLDYDFYFAEDDKKIEIDISDLSHIYDIIEKLKAKNIMITEIKQKDVDFERVYLNLTSEGGKRSDKSILSI
ncbi:ABC transporter ATP-binding protein [Clostridium sp. C2-6-12]|uniref:ABC transporter ATP-binding protein n=1 Tax=Clostridium sp. C2-6-12 TaxID=2698832 RepID=UPI00136EF4AB|nr:ABC transporter ATP-binding protein [Clostridium sp. C2-6-12]